MSKTVRIGCSSAFWGDSITAAKQLVDSGEIDYLVADYLAEVTMGILAKRRKHTENKKLGGAGVGGFVNEFVTFVIKPLLGAIVEKGIKVVTNAGGLNPIGLKDAIDKVAKEMGLNVKVAAVYGDDILNELDHIKDKLKPFAQSDGVEEDLPLSRNIESLNAYIGAQPIAKALDEGAQVVVTGRCVDSAIVLGPLIHEFKWKMDDFDKLAAGSVAGHIIECGCQATGGNFTDWKLAAYSENGGYKNMGYPIVNVNEDGSFVVSKPSGTGGIVSVHSVGEQLVYEIGDPRKYILPDVIVDFSRIQLKQIEKNQVLVTGFRGYPPTEMLKVSGIYMDGYKVTAELFLAGLDAREKALAVGHSVIGKVQLMLNNFGMEQFKDYTVEALGTEHTYGSSASVNSTREVVLRMTVHHESAQALKFFLVEIAPSATCMAPGIIGVSSGRPKPQGNMVHFSCLIPKSLVKPKYTLSSLQNEKQVNFKVYSYPYNVGKINQKSSLQKVEMKNVVYVPLIKLCVARSGDKGDSANIGIIARIPEVYDWLKQIITQDFVQQVFQHLISKNGSVVRYELPGIYALNFLITNCLGGGGLSSLNIDRQAKTYAQQLLSKMVPVPYDLLCQVESQKSNL